MGNLIQLAVSNDASLPVFSTSGYEYIRTQMTIITGKSGNSLNIWPPLYADYGKNGGVVYVTQAAKQSDFFGVEDLTIDANLEASDIILFQETYGSWMKNVRTYHPTNRSLTVTDSLQFEMRHAFIDEGKNGGTNGYGLGTGNVSAGLFEDNIISKNWPATEINGSSTGNVFAYNFADSDLNLNHGPHNSLNLYEGNVAYSVMPDGYFGGASHDTIFRNWLKGGGWWTVNLKRFTREYSIVGNLLGMPGLNKPGGNEDFGAPNIGNDGFTGFSPPAQDYYADTIRYGTSLTQAGNLITASTPIFVRSDQDDTGFTPRFILTSTGWKGTIVTYLSPTQVRIDPYSAVDITGAPRNVSGLAFRVTPGPSGWQERDTNVLATTVRKFNYYFDGNAIPTTQKPSGETLPPSLYRTAKPAWFGSLVWPPFNPFSPAATEDSIPAGYRYNHALADPPA